MLPLDQRLYRETGSRSRSSGGDTTGLRPDVEEIRYGASVGILASQLLRHCATAPLRQYVLVLGYWAGRAAAG